MYYSKKEAILVATLFGLAGFLTVLCLNLGNAGGVHFTIVATLAACLTAGIVWPIAMGRSKGNRWVHGCVCGGVIGLLSHVVHWYLMFTSTWVLQHASLIQVGPAGEAIDPVTALWACWLYSFIGWILFGYATLLGGCLAGLLAVSLQSLGIRASGEAGP